MRYDGGEEQTEQNGHPIPGLIEILLDISGKVGGLQTGQEITLDELRSTRHDMREDVIRLHERIDEIPRQEREGLLEWLGFSPREAIGLLIAAVMGLAGTLQGNHLLDALLGH